MRRSTSLFSCLPCCTTPGSAAKRTRASASTAQHENVVIRLEAHQQQRTAVNDLDSFLVVLDMTVNATNTLFESLEVEIQRIITSKKATRKQCKDCVADVQTIRKCNVIPGPQSFSVGTHKSSATLDIPSGSPATLTSKHHSIEYQIIATALLKDGLTISTIEPITFTPTTAQAPKTLTRRTAYTEFDIDITLPQSIHTGNTFPCSVVLNTHTKEAPNRHRRWSIRRLDWRIEEHETSTSSSCAQHKSDTKPSISTSTRTLSSGEAELSRRPDTELADNTTEKFLASLSTRNNPSPDAHLPDRFRVSHTIALELLVAEVPTGPDGLSRTGSSGVVRILKPKFDVVVAPSVPAELVGGAERGQTPPRYNHDGEAPPAYDG
ncbi:hypothetical protein BDZ85DRAFT_112392 [Elsinoe ampelina]|uniref:LDB19 N-terminal domain-containing protein n=1 Tax=Elsinoe ampelina TaxID=302913 RepID=A0A6A6GD56_9PEZI|nr:hypothetical protein BDZ85DRAFT_112392 [Elsinoe ampelina]